MLAASNVDVKVVMSMMWWLMFGLSILVRYPGNARITSRTEHRDQLKASGHRKEDFIEYN